MRRSCLTPPFPQSESPPTLDCKRYAHFRLPRLARAIRAQQTFDVGGGGGARRLSGLLQLGSLSPLERSARSGWIFLVLGRRRLGSHFAPRPNDLLSRLSP